MAINNKVYTKQEFDEIIKKVTFIINKFFERDYYNEENNKYKDTLDKKREIIYLANGDKLTYKVTKASLSHVLGINTEKLVTAGIIKDKGAYDNLKWLCENSFSVYNKCKEHVINFNDIISDYVDIKLDAFYDNVKLDIHNCEFVCKFEQSRAYGYNDNRDMDYMVVSKDDNYYYVLILAEQTNGLNKIYVPQSNRRYNTKEELIEYLTPVLNNQELTTINTKDIYYSDYSKQRMFVYNEEKKSKVEELKKWSSIVSCIPNVSSDYLYILSLFMNKRSDNAIDNEFIETFMQSINEGKIIDNIPLNINPQLKVLAESFNDSLIKGNVHSENDELNKESYTKILKEKEELEKRLSEALIENKKTSADFEDLGQRYRDLEAENKELKAAISLIEEALSSLPGKSKN